LYHIVWQNSDFHEENKPTGYTLFYLFTTDPTCFGLNDHHPGITIKLLQAFKTVHCSNYNRWGSVSFSGRTLLNV